jgi:hypothetical protein
MAAASRRRPSRDAWRDAATHPSHLQQYTRVPASDWQGELSSKHGSASEPHEHWTGAPPVPMHISLSRFMHPDGSGSHTPPTQALPPLQFAGEQPASASAPPSQGGQFSTLPVQGSVKVPQWELHVAGVQQLPASHTPRPQFNKQLSVCPQPASNDDGQRPAGHELGSHPPSHGGHGKLIPLQGSV